MNRVKISLAAVLCVAGFSHRSFASSADPSALTGEVLSSPALSVLDADERERFSARVGAFFSNWNRSTVDEYDALMKSWGGVFRVDANHESFRTMRDRDWHSSGSECSIRGFDAPRLKVEIMAALEPDGMTVTLWPINDGGGLGNIHYTIFSFGAGQGEMARDGAPVIQLTLPVEFGDGTRANMAMRWIRVQESGDWVPWMVYQTVPTGEGVCVLYF